MLSVRSMAFLDILGLGLSALGSGRHLRRHRAVDYRTELTELRVTGYGPFPYQVDGDYLGEVDELSFRHVPDALDLVIPDRAR